MISWLFGNDSTGLSTGCPVSPGRKAGRGVPPGRGIYPERPGFADRFDPFRDRMAAPGGLLLRLWPRLPRGKSFNHRCDYFSGAGGIWIDDPTARVGGGCKWASVGYGPSYPVRAPRWPPGSPSSHSVTFVVVVPAALMLAVREGFKWQSRRRIGREVSM